MLKCAPPVNVILTDEELRRLVMFFDLLSQANAQAKVQKALNTKKKRSTKKVGPQP